MAEERRMVAKKRWHMLIEVLTRKKAKIEVDNSLSVRRFASFGLLSTTALEEPRDPLMAHRWYQYSCPTVSAFKPLIRYLDSAFDVEDLFGFNNTGNVCVWPAEEVMTYYCLHRKELFKGKAVCELGGGMTCLAGISVAQCAEATEVLLTDGNEKSVQNVSHIIKKNRDLFSTKYVSTRLLRWNDVDSIADLKEHFDYIICADCLFFDDYREDLRNTLAQLLKPKGIVLCFAPRRGTTFDQFEKSASESFIITRSENYDQHVWDLHQKNLKKGKAEYDEDLHYPILLKMIKKDLASENSIGKDTTNTSTDLTVHSPDSENKGRDAEHR